jgi:two-component system NtrC family response regulator
MAAEYSILVIDDDPQLLNFFTGAFLKQGFYRAMGVLSGSKTLNIIQEKKPDIVLLDVDIKDEDSLVILHNIKMVMKDLPVVMLADESNKELAEKALGYGASSYIIKSSPAEEIVSNVKAELDKHLFLNPKEEAEILIVDDDKEICDMVEHFLKSNKYRCFSVHAAKGAIQAVKSRKPKLVLLDIVMPEADGIELLQQIKSIDKKIKVIMMSGVADKDVAVGAVLKGAAGYITKPFSLQQLKVTVLTALLE